MNANDLKGYSEFHVGQAVEVHAFGHWYPGVVVKVARTRVNVTYTSGTGTTRTKAVGANKIRAVGAKTVDAAPLKNEATARQTEAVEMKLVKLAMRRDPNAPVGIPARVYVECRSGHAPNQIWLDADSNTCHVRNCDKSYDRSGWLLVR
jgi:hypothetical protein